MEFTDNLDEPLDDIMQGNDPLGSSFSANIILNQMAH